MTKDEMLKVLKNSFKDFKFYEDGHYYTYKDKPVGISVTRFIAEYENEFNQQEVAEKVAIKENRPVEDILAEWKYKADFACAKGSECHYYAQTLWNKEPWDMMKFGFDGSIEYDSATELIQTQAENFYKDYQDHLEHLQDEFVVGSEEYNIASAIDHLFINKLTGGLVLVDYKTNSDIHKSEKYAKNMKVPLQHMKDFTLNHYYIQLSIYKYLLEKYTDFEINVYIASEYRYQKVYADKNTLIIATSQSGETADTITAVRQAKEAGLSFLHPTLRSIKES